MAIQKITADVIATSAVTTDSLSDSSITAAKLHTTLDLTGKTVTVATASAGDNDTTVASTAFVSTAIANLADSAPSTLDTLNELAAALGDDANFSTTVTNSIATKLPLAGGTLTGNVSLTTASYPKITLTDETGVDRAFSIGTDNETFTIRNETASSNPFVISNANNATFAGTVTSDGILLGDNDFILAGTGGDFKIGHDGTNNIVRSQGHPLYIDSNGITFRGYSPYTTHMKIDTNGDISFYEDTGATAKFFWDASNESLGLGLGIIAPVYALDLANASGGNLARFKDSDSSYNGIIIAGDTNAGWVGNSASNTGEGIYYQNSINAMRFYANGSEKARLNSSGNLIMTAGGTIRAGGANDLILDAGESGTPDIYLQSGGATKVKIEGSNGNVGIGTDTPQKKLHIEHTAGASEGILISGASDTAGHTAGILLRAEGGETDSALRAKAGIFLERTATYGIGKLHIANRQNGDNVSATISDAQITIYDNKVGIGTSSPTHPLSVQAANAKITACSTADSQIIGFQARYLLDHATLYGSFEYHTGDAQLYIDNNFTGNNGVYGDINFRNKDNGGSSLVSRMKIKGSTGNVGIGETDPLSKLHVEGNIAQQGTASKSVSSGTGDSGISLYTLHNSYARGSGRLRVMGTENNLNVGYAEYFYTYSYYSPNSTYYVNLKFIDESFVNNTYARPRLYLYNSSSYNNNSTNRQNTNQSTNSTNVNILQIGITNVADQYGTFQIVAEPMHWKP